MEAYKEFSTTSRERRLYQWGTLVLIGVSCAYEGYHTFALGQLSIMGWGYNLLFIILWCWRCLFQYSIQLTGDKLIVVMYGLGLERRMTVYLKDLESFSNHYKRSFFRKTAIKNTSTGILPWIPSPSGSWCTGKTANSAVCCSSPVMN